MAPHDSSDNLNDGRIAPFCANPPFAADSPGDCVLQTSDGMRFKVFRNILSLSSPFFHDMFSLPQQGGTATGSEPIPVIDITEDAQTVHTLLVLLYPTDVPVIETYDLATKLIEACDKYDIKLDRLRGSLSLRDLLTSPAALRQHALRAYALAWRLGLEEEAKNASRHLHSVDIRDRQIKQGLTRHAGSIDPLIALWDLRLRREEALDVLVDSIPLRKWVCLPHGGIRTDGSMSYANESNFRARARLLRHVTQLALQDPYPSCKDIRAFIGLHRVICGVCPGVPPGDVATASTALANMIERYPQTITFTAV